MERRSGYELPLGTFVYMWEFGRIKRTKIAYQKNSFLHCVFNPSDGLWATPATREHWDTFPHSHPQCTLFEMLNKKLEI
jgi:hypothetical protein